MSRAGHGVETLPKVWLEWSCISSNQEAGETIQDCSPSLTERISFEQHLTVKKPVTNELIHWQEERTLGNSERLKGDSHRKM